MTYKINNLMKANIGKSDIAEFSKKYPLTPKLRKILEGGVMERNGAIFLTFLGKGVTNSTINGVKNSKENSLDSDLTGYEMILNKLHIDLYIPKKKQVRAYTLPQGIAFALALRDILAKEFSGDSFEIVTSIDEGPDTYPESCRVSFHKVRPGERWLRDDFESYKQNGLLVITT